tara:strand:- start:289 stop:516 length:228 start_codon:yes stop_codon:yes gene_type:complete
MNFMRLRLRKDAPTALGWQWIEPVSFGYDSAGMLVSMLCKVWDAEPYGLHEASLECFSGHDLFEDLMVNYTVYAG